ncbi:GLPGLI family protein [compost metagenome]
MKIILTTFISIAFAASTYAQSADKALARVQYSFSHIQDTTQKDKPYIENMLLVIGRNASVYTSFDAINQAREMKKNLMEQIKNQSGSNNMSIRIDKTGLKPTTALDYFYFAKENKFYTKERVYNNYLVEETAPKIDWKITKDTASFSGVLCQKATTYFKGRNWIAWYSPELPFQSGPWKLNGLPGLILEAHDEKNEVVFQFAGLEDVSDKEEPIKNAVGKEEKTTVAIGGDIQAVAFGGLNSGDPYEYSIELPTDAIRATRKELDKLKAARDKDPMGFMKTQAAASGRTITVQGSRISGPTSSAPKIVLNNPIELPEKK